MARNYFQISYNHTIEIMRNALPYINTPAKKPMHMIIKVGELLDAISGNDSSELSACDIGNDSIDMEGMLSNIKGLCSISEQETIDMILNFIKVQRLYSTYQAFTKSNFSSGKESSNSDSGGMMDFLMSQLTPEQRTSFETMTMMLNSINP